MIAILNSIFVNKNNYLYRVVNFNQKNEKITTNYNNVTSTTDIYGNSELSSSLLDIYNNIFNITWPNAVSSGDYLGDLGANEAKLEYHLKSEFGRWNGTQWIIDDSTSICIDAGNLTDNYSNEPTPNGSTINLGAYGNTEFTSKSSNLLDIVDYANIDDYIYPNPTLDKIIVPSVIINAKYSIYTLTGKRIKFGKLNSNEIRISELNYGMDILKIRDNKLDKMKLFKIIKE